MWFLSQAWQLQHGAWDATKKEAKGKGRCIYIYVHRIIYIYRYIHILSFLVRMMLPGGDFFEPKPAWFYGCRRFGDSTWVLNVEAEVVKTAMVLWVIPQIGDLFNGKSQSKMDDNGGSPILGNLQC